MSDPKPTGRARIVALLNDTDVEPGAFSGRGFSITWSEERIALESGDHALEIGPGDGDQLVVQISRSAGWGERGFISRLLRRPAPKVTWLNLRLRSRAGMPPLYVRAAMPRSLDLVGIPVLPGVATEMPTGDLFDLLKAVVHLEAHVSSWSWDDTEELEVQSGGLAEISDVLSEPGTPSWMLICDWYDALDPEEADALRPRLLGELARWPDALREFNPDLSSLELGPVLERQHHHLELSCVLRITPLDVDTLQGGDLTRLAESRMTRHLSTLVIHNGVPTDAYSPLFRGGDLVSLFTSGAFPALRHVTLIDFDMNPYEKTFFQDLVEAPSSLIAQLETLELRNMRLGPRDLQVLMERFDEGLPLRALALADDTRIGDGGIRNLLLSERVSELERLTLDTVGLSFDGALDVLDHPALSGLASLTVAWVQRGRPLRFTVTPEVRVTELDLYDTDLRSHQLYALLGSSRVGPLTRLSLASNPNLGRRAISRLRGSRKLRTTRLLDLSHCDLDDKDIVKLSHEGHTTFPALQELNLRGATIEDEATYSALDRWRLEAQGLRILT